jgi:hypothetical protein
LVRRREYEKGETNIKRKGRYMMKTKMRFGEEKVRVRRDTKRIKLSNEKYQVQTVCVKRTYNLIYSGVLLEGIREEGWVSVPRDIGVTSATAFLTGLEGYFCFLGLQYKVRRLIVWRHNMKPHAYFV